MACPMKSLGGGGGNGNGSGSGGCGCHSSFWVGLVVGAFLTWAHVGMIQEQQKRIKRNMKKKKLPYRAPGNKAWRMSKWIKHGGIIRTQGLCGDFSKMPGSSVGQQTAEALEKLDEILQQAGVTRKHLLSVTIFLADIERDFEAMNEVYDKWVDPQGLPTRLCVQAGMEGVKVEIRAEAYYDEEDDDNNINDE